MTQQLLIILLQEKKTIITSIQNFSLPCRNRVKEAIHLKVLLQMLLSRRIYKKIPGFIPVL